MQGDVVPHIPVLPHEVCDAACVQPGDVIVDGTFGAGGHSRLLTAQLDGRGVHIGVDRDPSVVARYEQFSQDLPSSIERRLLRMPFPDAFAELAREDVSADVVILDVGVSSMHIDEAARGFSYMQDGPLDMRMDPSSGESAAHLLATRDALELESILREYGEEKYARRIAESIVASRADHPLERTSQLVELVERSIPRQAQYAPGHSARRVFQALRVAVNDELGMLDRGLDAALELLAPGGRLVVISFHSLEDRMVKRRFASWQGRCTCPPGLPVCACGATALVRPITRKAVVGRPEEVAENPRAASAKLRAVAKVNASEHAA